MFDYFGWVFRWDCLYVFGGSTVRVDVLYSMTMDSIHNLTMKPPYHSNVHSHEWCHTRSGCHLMHCRIFINELQSERRRSEQTRQLSRILDISASPLH